MDSPVVICRLSLAFRANARRRTIMRSSVAEVWRAMVRACVA